MYNRFLILVILCFAFAIAMPINGRTEEPEQNGQDSSTPMRELLLMQDIPVVVITAAKVEQPILESPSTITVLIKKDIERYGMTSVTDILRNVPGVYAVSLSATDRNVGIRGLNELASSRILSLVDGMPVYMDFYGLTSWEALPVAIEEIERIEIIRGPGSALYGANAFDGIINIITDSSLKNLGTRMTTKLDHSGRLSGSMVQGDRYDNVSYKASLGWDSISGWDGEDSSEGGNRRFSGHLRYNINDDSDVRLYGNLAEHQGKVTGLHSFEPIAFDTREGNLKFAYVRSGLRIHSFYRGITSEGSISGIDLFHLENDSIDSEIQHSFRPVSRNFITWGINHRFNQIDSNILGGLRRQNIWAAYMQDQVRLCRCLNLTAGLRYDRHPLTGDNFSPRASFVYSPKREHALRASLGRAFRNPAFVHSYMDLDYLLSMPPFPEPIDIKIHGDAELSPEWITSLEIGYHGRFGSRIRGGLDIYLNRIQDLIDFDLSEYYAEDALFPGSPGGVIPSLISVSNELGIDALGGEAEIDVFITSWLSAYANYSYQYMEDSETGEELDDTIQHKVNPALSIRPGKNILVSLFANYVSGIVEEGTEVDPYIMLNSVVSYTLGTAKIGLSVSNLLNDKHLEHPDGNEIGRSMILSLTYQIH